MRGVTAARIASGSGATTTTRAPESRERAEQAEVLVGRRHDLVVRAEPEPAEHDVAAVGRARRERDLQRLGADERREARAAACSRSSITRAKYGMPLRPVAIVALELRARSRRSVARAIGPKVPALR